MSTASAAPAAAKKKGSGVMPVLQRIGRSLMLPVAVMPAAALLVRLGADDMLGRESFPTWITKIAGYMSAGGGAIIDNIALLFCVGIAIGFAKKSDGSTGLAAVAGYLVFQKVLATFTDSNLPKVQAVVDGKIVENAAPVNAGVLGGVVMGIVVALLYQKFYRTKLPDWAGFFGGRRLVPILSSFAGLVLGIVFGLIWPVLGAGLHNFGEWLVGSGAVGAGIFGVANRSLIPIGMHHLLNSFPWWQAGDYNGKHGDIPRFLEGDPTAGQFMTGFFPIMMFALPAACLAITHCARPERRKVVGGMMFSLALTAFVTGITEPIEFTFMFIAPVLYAIHAVLTGVSMALTWALGMKDGFGFSAGFIDYALNFGAATKPIGLAVVGLCFAALYYVVFRFAITKWNLPTPGRESDEELAELQKAEAK
ncbi:PTS transporter subunit EIIC [Streptomyces formicae]|uniref:PTS system, N-acetylglucosamine-specific IIB component / PTS system, N-acetylglucosamine-specific IIC component n=1 Tax=Streptomyces formicae TaxID=1616117 RepID=A0A291Q8V7_9ACTN|nr:PTS transporter subunit EIIC [Streptomyces formicae]ATL28062.1 PTS system, N-acetylglucosamine-specific IIB component / PTS system, N-acetylglucosamine-specific IIC component [Streptomyces formicae]